MPSSPTVHTLHTLHIEHPVTDFTTWHTAFDRFAGAREKAGVRAHRIERPTDDERFVHLELEFDDVKAAEGFLAFLRRAVWSNPAASPGLDGEPTTRILRRWD
jgi:hypothetical protein